MFAPVRIHPDNPKVFEFRDKPLVLLTATEHYGAVMNRRFRFDRYLADAADKGMTLTRLFMLFRELQSAANPYSTCKPESTDYVAPFKRVGHELALDCQPKYDLSQWNDEFFDRLEKFMALSSEYGIVVEIVLFSNTYTDAVWALNPLNPRNNINGIEPVEWPEYTTTRHARLFEWQVTYARKIVEVTRSFDNVIYEICNEPGGGYWKKPTYPSPQEVDQWQAAIVDVICEADAPSSRGHLIAGQPAFHYPTEEHWEDPVTQPADAAFNGFPIDVVNMHPLPRMAYGDRVYNLGRFMLGDLNLAELRAYVLACYREGKPLNLDEDNVATQYRDTMGWTIHRKRAWTTVLGGAHYDMIDFSIWPYLETGTEDSQRELRMWFKYLSQTIDSLDVVRGRPMMNWVTCDDANVVASVFAVEGEDYCVYLADGRERYDDNYGKAINAEVGFTLPEREDGYRFSVFNPVTGQTSPHGTLEAGQEHMLTVPAFEHDLVLRIRCS